MRWFPRLAVVSVLTVGALGAPAPVDAAPGDAVRFSSAAFTVNERDCAVTVRVERSGPVLVGRTTVDYATVSGTAVPATDYTDASGTLVFEVGERTKTFAVTIRDDQLPEPVEDLAVVLSDARGELETGTPATIYIVDEDSAGRAPLPAGTPDGPTGKPSRAATPVGASPAPAPAPRRSVASKPPPPVRTESGRRHRLAYRQRTGTPFELRPPERGATPLAAAPTDVDPLLALIAGLLLARVGAEVWFRTRVDSEA